MCALIDATKDQTYKISLDLFEKENEKLFLNNKKLSAENTQMVAQLLINEQIINEKDKAEREQSKEFDEKLQELRDEVERKEYLLQSAEKRINEYESLLHEIAEYDDYVKQTMQQWGIMKYNADTEQKISNVVFENKKLQVQLEAATLENEGLKQLIEAMNNLNTNLVFNEDASVSDI